MINRGNVGEVQIQVETDLQSVITQLIFEPDDTLVSFFLEAIDRTVINNDSLRQIINGIQEMIDD